MNRTGGWRIVLVALVVAGAAAVTLLAPSPTLADDMALGSTAGDYYPVTSTDVRMESETVQAICYRDYAEFKVDFLFVNSGAPQTLQLGFPFARDLYDQHSGGLTAFRAWRDGRPLAIQQGEGPDLYQSYYLHRAVFPRGKTTITVRYLASPTDLGYYYPELRPPQFKIDGISEGPSSYDYWLHTGEGWAGTIGKAVIRFTLADDFRGYGMDFKYADLAGQGLIDELQGDWDQAASTRPEDYTKLSDRIYQWVFTDFEPSEFYDIHFAFSSLSMDNDRPTPAVLGAVAKTVSTSGVEVFPSDWDDPALLAVDTWPATAVHLTGRNPWIKIGVEGDQAIREIRIIPGRNDSIDSFPQYGRPKTIKVTLSDGTTSTIKLADEPGLQKFPISGTAEWARLDVIDSYPGTKSSDVYIADVSFSNHTTPSFEPFVSLITTPTTTTLAHVESPGYTVYTTSTTSPVTSETAAVTTAASTTTSSYTAPAFTSTPSPGTSLASTGPTRGPVDTQAKDSERTVWLIVLAAVAGSVYIAAILLAATLISRRRGRSA